MRRAFNLALSIGVTLGALYWTFKDTEWNALWLSLRHANYWWLLPNAVALALIHVFRTLRWGNLLSPQEKVSFPVLNEAAAIGFMMLVILPFRLGEFARPLLIAQRSKIGRAASMSSVVLERIADGLFIAALLWALLLFVPDDGSQSLRLVRVGGNMMFLVFGAGFAFLLFAAWQHDRAVRLIRGTFGVVSEKLAHKVSAIVDSFVSATKQLPDRRNSILFFVYTVLFWGVNAVGLYCLARAFNCGGGAIEGCRPLELSLFQSMFVICVLVVGVMIPAAPGSAGTYQYAVVVALSLFFSDETAHSTGVALANVSWLMGMGAQVLLGLFFMVRGKQSFADLTRRLDREQQAAA